MGNIIGPRTGRTPPRGVFAGETRDETRERYNRHLANGIKCQEKRMKDKNERKALSDNVNTFLDEQKQ